ncbi:hypothetical protein [Thiorhodococcus minor]|uniref:Site-specific integrase n=1 Tax=Thiorhodococcus minor TaxID=57489 RepID=A0A6M0K6N4_9GAMM|nr:hypothetical protein [Thiorhodococcus minor]NEV65119.1 hypothetical protein [Thiorhodococcus minor]
MALSPELGLCMLAIAARTGMNPTPLCELPVDCLQRHPLKSNRKLLVSYKRRGNATHIQALRKNSDIQVIKTVLPDVEAIVDTVKRRNAPVRAKKTEDPGWLFVYETRDKRTFGSAAVFNQVGLAKATSDWCQRHDLRDDAGNPLRLNVMRLRKTFENRIWELSGQDPFVTAKLSGHSLKVSNDHYLEAPKDAEKDFRFLGEVLTKELLSQPSVRSLPSENTPVSKCRDTLHGQFAPKARGEHCTNFLACVRCRSFVVTEDDLWRLFSYYWLLVSERNRIGSHKWSRYYAHIVRIIDRDIAPQFDSAVVHAARQRAKDQPHPFWKTWDQLETAL